MQVERVTSSHGLYGKKCKLCSKPFRSGDSVLAYEHRCTSGLWEWVAWHRECLAPIVASAPLSRDDARDEVVRFVERVRLERGRRSA